MANNRTLKPRRWWGITYINGNDVIPHTIRRTRKEAQTAYSELWTGPHSWDFWQKQGYRAVRVTVIVEGS